MKKSQSSRVAVRRKPLRRKGRAQKRTRKPRLEGGGETPWFRDSYSRYKNLRDLYWDNIFTGPEIRILTVNVHPGSPRPGM